ncbi:MAG: glycosyltransferase family 39 protein [Patescibacteria group bacterium]
MSKQKVALVILSVIFFAAYSWFGLATPNIFNSPDETANYFFISRLHINGDFFSPEPLNAFLNSSIHPRSISYNGFSLVPQGFIGLPLLYGFLSKVLGLFLIKFFTPLLAVLGALAFYGIIGKTFNHKIAFLSMLLLLLFPAYWYYSSRYLYPNVPFLAFFLIAVWALYCGALHKEKKIKYLFIFSVSAALALAIRPVESLWFIPIIIIGIVLHRKKLSITKVAASLGIMLALAAPILVNSYILYGDPLGTGYGLMQAVDYSSAPAGIISSGAPNGQSIFLPYGFNAGAIAKNVYKILIKYFWWFSIPAALGFFALFFCKIKKEEKFYIIGTLAVSIWLIIYYGSGVFYDNPNMGRLSMGDSHFRYWLPVFALAMPFAASFWVRLGEKIKQEKILISSVLIFVSFLSIYAVFSGVDDGLRAVRQVLWTNYGVKMEVMKILPENSIVITGRQDKIFFPDIKVLYSEKLDNSLILNIVKTQNPFYYYGVGLNAEDLVKTNNFLRIYGLKLERVRIFGKEVLYKLKKINEAAV